MHCSAYRSNCSFFCRMLAKNRRPTGSVSASGPAVAVAPPVAVGRPAAASGPIMRPSVLPGPGPGPGSCCPPRSTSNQRLPARPGNQRWHRTPSRHGSARSARAFRLTSPPLGPSHSASHALHGNAPASSVPAGLHMGTLGTPARPPAAWPAVQSPGSRHRATVDLPSRPVCVRAGGSLVRPR